MVIESPSEMNAQPRRGGMLVEGEMFGDGHAAPTGLTRSVWMRSIDMSSLRDCWISCIVGSINMSPLTGLGAASTRCPRKNTFIAAFAAPGFFTGTTNILNCMRF